MLRNMVSPVCGIFFFRSLAAVNITVFAKAVAAATLNKATANVCNAAECMCILQFSFKPDSKDYIFLPP